MINHPEALLVTVQRRCRVLEDRVQKLEAQLQEFKRRLDESLRSPRVMPTMPATPAQSRDLIHGH